MSNTLLALDTSTEACSAALYYQGQIIERYQFAPRQHNKLLLPMVEELLQETGVSAAKLDAVAFGCGPGSFTGLRIAACVVQGIAFAHDLPVIPLSTLQTIAQGVYREFQSEQVLVALDAAMQEIYYGEYSLKDKIMIPVAAEKAIKPELVSLPSYGSWVGAGSGWDLYAEILQQKLGSQLQQWFPHRYPRASDMLTLAIHAYQQHKTVADEEALPVYLREDVVRKNG